MTPESKRAAAAGNAESSGLASETENRQVLSIEDRVRLAVHAALERKAIDLRVLELTELCDFTDYFLILSGNSERQVKAIAEAISETLKAHRVSYLHVEGLGRGQWVLMDYGDFVVHVLVPERRDFYRLESLWSEAPEVASRFAASDRVE